MKVSIEWMGAMKGAHEIKVVRTTDYYTDAEGPLVLEITFFGEGVAIEGTADELYALARSITAAISADQKKGSTSGTRT